MPRPTFAPMAKPKLLAPVPPLGFPYRIPGETYGSMLRPGVGRFTLTPTAAIAVVSVLPPPEVVAAPPCRFTAIGIRLPPMTRNPTFPPIDVRLLLAPLGL